MSSNVKKPKNLVGLPPETRVVIQVSLEPLQPGLVEVASITLNASDSESSPPPKLKVEDQKIPVNSTFSKSEASISVKVKNPIKNKKIQIIALFNNIKYWETNV